MTCSRFSLTPLIKPPKWNSYMKNNILKFALITSGVTLCAGTAHAQTTVFSENFDPIPETLTDFNMQLGGDPEMKPANTKIFALDQWGITANASLVDLGGANGFVLQPQLDTKQNGRLAGIFIDPAHFASTGAGTYTLTFDVIAGSSPGAGRVYVGAGSGYDLSGTTDAKLNLNISTAGFGVRKADGELAWPALTGLNGATATHLITTSTEWIDSGGTQTGEFRDAPGAPFDVETSATLSVEFEYDGTSAVVIAFGGYDTDVKIDNIVVTSAAPDDNKWAGYDIDENGYVNTGDWMGMVYAANEPWVWRAETGEWLYIPDTAVTTGGVWGFMPR